MAKRKKKRSGGNMKTTTIEIIGLDQKSKEEFHEAKQEWFDLLTTFRQIKNTMLSLWRQHHELNNSPVLLIDWMKKDREWAIYKNEMQRWKALTKSKRGDKPKKPRGKERPKCPVEFFPNELSNGIFHELTRRFPDVATASLSAAMQRIREKLSETGTNTAYNEWKAILVGLQSQDSFNKEQPIIVRAEQPKIIPPDDPKKPFRVKVSLSRTAPNRMIRRTLVLWFRGKKFNSQKTILSRIASGEYVLKGSQIIYLQNKKKWLFAFTYTMPEPKLPKLDKSEIAKLYPSKLRPLNLTLPDDWYVHWIGYDGKHIGEKRQRVFLTRRKRANYYQYANTNSKGHGFGRAGNWRPRYQRNWNDFVKTCNGQMASSVCKKLIEKNVGVLEYFEPVESLKPKAFLSTTGKGPEWNDATTWDWHGLKTALSRECHGYGIEFIERELGGKRDKKEKAA